jgi:serine/threonine protein kinase
MAGSSVVGYTPGYAPPEQVTGKGTDERSELFSLAATLYYLLTNQAPPDAMLRLGETTNDEPDPL